MFLLIIRFYVGLTVFMILQMHVYCISKWIIKIILLFVMRMFLEVTVFYIHLQCCYAEIGCKQQQHDYG